MTDRFVDFGGLRLRTESFGDPSGTPLLLIMGASAPGCYWRDEFVDGFVKQGNAALPASRLIRPAISTLQ